MLILFMCVLRADLYRPVVTRGTAGKKNPKKGGGATVRLKKKICFITLVRSRTVPERAAGNRPPGGVGGAFGANRPGHWWTGPGPSRLCRCSLRKSSIFFQASSWAQE